MHVCYELGHITESNYCDWIICINKMWGNAAGGNTWEIPCWHCPSGARARYVEKPTTAGTALRAACCRILIQYYKQTCLNTLLYNCYTPIDASATITRKAQISACWEYWSNDSIDCLSDETTRGIYIQIGRLHSHRCVYIYISMAERSALMSTVASYALRGLLYSAVPRCPTRRHPDALLVGVLIS